MCGVTLFLLFWHHWSKFKDVEPATSSISKQCTYNPNANQQDVLSMYLDIKTSTETATPNCNDNLGICLFDMKQRRCNSQLTFPLAGSWRNVVQQWLNQTALSVEWRHQINADQRNACMCPMSFLCVPIISLRLRLNLHAAIDDWPWKMFLFKIISRRWICMFHKWLIYNRACIHSLWMVLDKLGSTDEWTCTS